MRMGWGRRTLALLGLMMILALPQAALGEGAFTMAGFDGDNGTHVWETNGFFARMEKRTGVSFTFEQHSDYAAWNARKDAMFAAGELPDVFFKAELTTDELIRYTESGQLVDLAPLLEANAPNLWALLQQHPDWLAAITLPSGKIGALPTLNTLPSQHAMWINQTWLDNLGLAAPTDAESFREVLRAFLTQDPNRNGKQDEIPLTFNGVWDLKFLLHAFGLAGNDYNLYLDEAGQVRFVPLEEAYPAALAYLRSLYEEKLLYQYGFNTADTLRTVTDENTAETYGVVLGASPMQLIPYAHSKDYVLLMPLQYEGKQVYRDLFGPVTRGTFAITSACADPAALSWGLEEAIAAFLDGKAAVCDAWPTLGITKKGNDPEQSKIVGKWTLGTFPYEKNGITNLSAWDVAINAASAKKDLGWEFIKMYTSPENQQRFYEEFYIFSPRKAFWEQDSMKAPEFVTLRTALDTALMWWRIAASVEADTAIGTNVNAFLAGQIDADTAVANMKQGLEQALKMNPVEPGVKNFNR